MLKRIRNLIKSKDHCVFATVGEGQPHCSLMAYLPNDACSEIYMLTDRDSQKYRNLQQNPSVSLLIDNRGENTRGKTLALTVEGRYAPQMQTEKRRRVLDRLLAAFPHLQGLAESPNLEVICLKVQTFQLLEGPTEAHYVEL